MLLRWLCALVLPLAVGAAYAPEADAQPASSAYAAGVNAFFNGPASQAEALLSQALAEDPNDVRAFYFRGLARLRSGRRAEAEEDFRIGASLEAAWAGRPLDIGHTLERVQGADRLLLERIRKETRLGVDAHRAETNQQRYQQTRQRTAGAVRAPFRLPLGALGPTATPDELAGMAAAQADAIGNPFADDDAPRMPAPIDVPDAARGAVSSEQLGGVLGGMLRSMLPSVPPSVVRAVPGAAPQGGDPFGAAPGGDALGGPTDDDPFGAAPSDDPFGGGSDPFGGSAAGDTDDPFGAPAAGADEDPFGAAGGDPFGGGESDPFGEADGDPFGEASEDPSEEGDADPFGDDDADSPF